MAEGSKIQWTTHTFNPWTGCTKVSPGCANCYAEGWSKRSGIVKWGKGEPRRRTSESNWREPLKWNRLAEGAPERPRVFCASLADWLDDEVPIEWLADMLKVIADTPHLDWLLLTKRPENWRSRLGDDDSGVFGYATDTSNSSMPGSYGWDLMEFVGSWLNGTPPKNVWIGTTVENQEMADKRIPLLRSIPATVRFLSCEPLLGPTNLPVSWLEPDSEESTELVFQGIHWVIAGGESGPKARAASIDWFRSLRIQCRETNTAFFMKQLGGTKSHRGELEDFPEDLRIREFPVGKEPA